MLSTIQTVLMPCCFGFLFLSMLFCWGQTAFFPSSSDKRLYNLIFSISLLSLTILLVVRWIESGHFPLSNLYESLLFLSWSFLFFQLILQSISINPFKETQNKIYFENEQSDQQKYVDMLQAIVSPLALVSYAFAFFDLPKEMQQATALVPALQSNWLMMHVTVMILSYAALLCGSLLSMAFLFINFFSQEDSVKTATNLSPTRETSAITGTGVPARAGTSDLANGRSGILVPVDIGYKLPISWLVSLGMPAKTAFTDKSKDLSTPISMGLPAETEIKLAANLSLCERLDNYSYRMLGLGFPLLTVGILSGAVWANSAWGSYWSWDPKETWALITWLIFAIYLHARISKGLSGKRPAQIATIGFFVVWFCYLGVNLLGSGLHTYGSFYTK